MATFNILENLLLVGPRRRIFRLTGSGRAAPGRISELLALIASPSALVVDKTTIV
jgi:hypothetical protein